MDNNRQNFQDRPERLLSIDDLAEYFQVSKKTIYRLLEQKQLPAVRVARQWRFRKQDIESWLDRKASEEKSA